MVAIASKHISVNTCYADIHIFMPAIKKKAVLLAFNLCYLCDNSALCLLASALTGNTTHDTNQVEDRVFSTFAKLRWNNIFAVLYVCLCVLFGTIDVCGTHGFSYCQ
uniref:Uncharacterized protein n=1 Tax=Rhipicephalus appendiculatus TaxID=34631 RepID=A0A131YDK6_RHIAP